MIALGVRHRNADGLGDSRHVPARGDHRPGLRDGAGLSTWTTQRTSAAWRRGFGIAYLGRHSGRVGMVENIWRAAGWFCLLMTAVSFLKMYLWFAASTQ